MSDELQYSIEKFGKALVQFQEGLKMVTSDLARDGVIKRFEYTFELLWKTLKIQLLKEGVSANSPRDVLKEAFRLNWLSEEKAFLDMLQDRNTLSHAYSLKKVEEVFGRIQAGYDKHIEMVLNLLKSMNA